MTKKNLDVIKVLPEAVVSQIAAGEVVERPASVVKELIENAIDASARRLEIEIKEGGQKLIEIADDGVGMSQQDAVLAFSQHATSKIGSIEDFDRLCTLGFRGEALASIASVSRVDLVSRREELDLGTHVHVEGGHIKLVENTSHPRGSRIQVKNLFYNVPARRKFLKSQQAEMAAISDMVCHYILGYPEIGFRFTRGNVPLTHSNGSGNLIDAILAVYGTDVAKSLLPLKEPDSLTGTGITIRGFISSPNEPKTSTRYMTTLVNRRYVKSKLMAQAIAKALSEFFPKGRFPVLIFDLRMPNDLVDVNVHPQKIEVRFKDERWVFGMVLETIKNSLSGLKLVTPAYEVSRPAAAFQNPQFPSVEEDKEQAEFWEAKPDYQPPANVVPISGKVYQLKNEPAQPPQTPLAGAFEPVRSLSQPRILAQFMNTYLLGEDREGIFIVDQHVAHERVLFDTYVETYRDIKVNAQPLLFPVPLKLLPSERMLMKERSDQLRDLGFVVQEEEDGQFYATAIPVMGERASEADLIQDLMAEILGGWETKSLAEVKSEVLKTMACKAAVKAGDPLKDTEMRSLFEQLLKTKNPFTCPHGRPIVLRISLKQIEHGFLRA